MNSISNLLGLVDRLLSLGCAQGDIVIVSGDLELTVEDYFGVPDSSTKVSRGIYLYGTKIDLEYTLCDFDPYTIFSLAEIEGFDKDSLLLYFRF